MKLRAVIDKMPDASTQDALAAFADRDPVVWSMLRRRVKGQVLRYDNRKQLTEESLGEVRRTMLRSDYEDELYSRLLHHRPFLKQPLRDKHKHKAYEKSRQVGVSELAVTEVIHFLATHPGTKIILTFPRDKQLTDFSVTRIAPIFDESPGMRGLVGIPNQVFTKRIGDSYLILRSAWESNLGEGVDADAVFLDEKDRMRDKIEYAFRESLKSSKFGLLREYSTPTLPGRGIDIPFKDSDQQVWLVRCLKCSLEQEIDYRENIVAVKDVVAGTRELEPESYDFMCRKTTCRGKLDRVFSGRWVPRHPDRKHIRGYHVSQLMAPWISATRVMQDKIDMRFLQIWLNYVCGLPSSSDALLGDEDFVRACGNYDFVTARTNAWAQVVCGIDWGFYNWCVVLGRNEHNMRWYLLNIGVFEDTAEELGAAKKAEAFMAPYTPDLVVADSGYGKDRNSYLLRRLCPNGTEGRFYAQMYNPSPKSSRTFQPEWSDPQRARVLCDRTMQLKNACHAIREREFGLPRLDLDNMVLFRRHFRALAPLKEIDDESKEIVESISASGEDHLAHATGSALLAAEKLSKASRFGFSFGTE